ncbi:excalibur calcium-binding domain-containing protein [Mycobacterium sp. THU-M104]|uniref:excalibur calcium-binding domain-containing protein n=1 Tax=Mycobacterium sp. THU-M104 TaxID=3410515 RepID=UPI003B9D3551
MRARWSEGVPERVRSHPTADATSVAGMADSIREADAIEAHADGRYNILSDDSACAPKPDRDNDGLACEAYNQCLSVW